MINHVSIEINRISMVNKGNISIPLFKTRINKKPDSTVKLISK